jgi:hypothetical protein
VGMRKPTCQNRHFNSIKHYVLCLFNGFHTKRFSAPNGFACGYPD